MLARLAVLAVRLAMPDEAAVGEIFATAHFARKLLLVLTVSSTAAAAARGVRLWSRRTAAAVVGVGAKVPVAAAVDVGRDIGRTADDGALHRRCIPRIRRRQASSPRLRKHSLGTRVTISKRL